MGSGPPGVEVGAVAQQAPASLSDGQVPAKEEVCLSRSLVLTLGGGVVDWRSSQMPPEIPRLDPSVSRALFAMFGWTTRSMEER